MRVAWIDCSAGASGDMLLGAFISAGADLEVINTAVAAVDPSLSVTVEMTSRHQIAATKASVRVAGELHPENVPDGARAFGPRRGGMGTVDERARLGTGMGTPKARLGTGMGMLRQDGRAYADLG